MNPVILKMKQFESAVPGPHTEMTCSPPRIRERFSSSASVASRDAHGNHEDIDALRVIMRNRI